MAAGGDGPGTSAPMSAAVWAQLLLLGAIWGGSFLFARIAVQEVPPLALVLLRVGIAAAVLHLFLAARGIPFAPALRRAPFFLLLGLLNNVVPFSLMFFGQTELGAGLASVLNATTPFWTILLAVLVRAEAGPGAARLAGVLAGIAGTAVMIGPGLATGLGGPAWAKLALLGTALSYAFALLVARRAQGMAPAVVATGQLTASTLIMAPVVALIHGAAGFSGAGAGTWAAVLALALLATAIAYILYFRIIAAAGATNASLVTLIVPASAVLLGRVFLGEELEAFEVAGVALVGTGLLLVDGRLPKMLLRRAAAPKTGLPGGPAGKKIHSRPATRIDNVSSD